MQPNQPNEDDKIQRVFNQLRWQLNKELKNQTEWSQQKILIEVESKGTNSRIEEKYKVEQ